MNDKIANEIVRLVQEIAEDEKQIRNAEETAKCMFTESGKANCLNEAKRYKESLGRKIELLHILKA